MDYFVSSKEESEKGLVDDILGYKNPRTTFVLRGFLFLKLSLLASFHNWHILQPNQFSIHFIRQNKQSSL